MPTVLNDRLVSYASLVDQATLQQAYLTAKMPFIHPYLVLMPDAHLGKGATVGSVLPTLGAIMPAAVGVDIGCGMMAVRTQFTREQLVATDLRALHQAISSAVPLSAGRFNSRLSDTALPRVRHLETLPGRDQASQVLPTWPLQLGTLGSGNHFIEVSYDEEDRVWLFLHSGSRGVGNKLATDHIRVAQDYCRRMGFELPDRDLAYLEEFTDEFDTYLEALTWAQRFAYLNREEMMDRVVTCVADHLGESVVRETVVNCHHNYTTRETYVGEEVWLSRKGAIDAHEGVSGLIPGSMGDLSYVVTGKGNETALNSSPHGAGRSYSRSAAKRTFTRADLDDQMRDIVWGESDAFLDEHPDAYKPIAQVMADAKDLVEIHHTLRQLVNVKGN